MSAKKPRVLHLCASRAFGGAESVACSIIEGLREEYDGVYASPEGEIRRALEARGVAFVPVPSLGKKDVRALIETTQPALVHAHDYTASLSALLAARGAPVVSHIHSNNPLMRTLNVRSLAYGVAMPRFRGIAVVDQAVIDEHAFRRGMARRAVVVPNFVDLSKVRANAAAESPPAVDLAFVGRLSPAKDPLGFLRIVRKVADQKPDLCAAMVGDGELQEEVRRTVTELGLGSIVDLRGFQANPHAHIGRSKTVVVPSVVEGFGLVAVEAMALGVPVLARSVGGLRRVVGNSKAGRLLNSEEEFCASALELLGSSSLRDEMSAEGPSQAAAFGDKDRFLDSFRALYAGAL